MLWKHICFICKNIFSNRFYHFHHTLSLSLCYRFYGFKLSPNATELHRNRLNTGSSQIYVQGEKPWRLTRIDIDHVSSIFGKNQGISGEKSYLSKRFLTHRKSGLEYEVHKMKTQDQRRS